MEEVKQDLKELRQEFHKLDKTVERLATTIEQQHKNMENLLREDISSNSKKHDEYDARLDNVEKEIAGIKAEQKAKDKSKNVWIAIGGVAATILAVVIGVVVDHYFLK